jgi:toxin FitB
MIIFDTSLISEAISPMCDSWVRAWLKTVDHRALCTTAINLLEIRSAISILADGQRKTELLHVTENYMAAVFSGRSLPFDHVCATAFAQIHADMMRRGQAIGFADCQIAAIALVNNYPIATRDIEPFKRAGLQVINPWTDE